ncbi:MAG: type II toxin-antitoxin system VapC family toxin [Acidobacteriota bacterium]
MKKSVYIETTVISYLAARPSRDLVVAANQQLTREWWSEQSEKYSVFASQWVLQEAAAGDASVAARRLELLSGCEILATPATALQLAEAILASGAVPQKASEDAFHLAVATVNGMDYLLSWNCRHIVNANIQKRLARACAEVGYELPIICTPQALVGE